MNSANDRQVGGKHYKVAAIQHWDLVAMCGMDYYTGNATKYVTRWRKKNGLEDLFKASHYITKLLELAKDEKIRGAGVVDYLACMFSGAPNKKRIPRHVLKEYVCQNELEELEECFLMAIVGWRSVEDIRLADRILSQLIRKATREQDAAQVPHDPEGATPDYVDQAKDERYALRA